MAVEQWRNGELIATLVDDQDYSYDSPAIYKYASFHDLPPFIQNRDTKKYQYPWLHKLLLSLASYHRV